MVRSKGPEREVREKLRWTVATNLTGGNEGREETEGRKGWIHTSVHQEGMGGPAEVTE